MPVKNCCLGCQGPNAGPCGPVSSRMDGCTGPCCVHSVGRYCQSFCGPPGCIHGLVFVKCILLSLMSSFF